MTRKCITAPPPRIGHLTKAPRAKAPADFGSRAQSRPAQQFVCRRAISRKRRPGGGAARVPRWVPLHASVPEPQHCAGLLESRWAGVRRRVRTLCAQLLWGHHSLLDERIWIEEILQGCPRVALDRLTAMRLPQQGNVTNENDTASSVLCLVFPATIDSYIFCSSRSRSIRLLQLQHLLTKAIEFIRFQ